MFKTAFNIIRQATSVSKEDMDEITEVMKMTRLGQKLITEGINTGREETKFENAKNLINLLSEEVIAERIGLPLEPVFPNPL